MLFTLQACRGQTRLCKVLILTGSDTKEEEEEETLASCSKVSVSAEKKVNRRFVNKLESSYYVSPTYVINHCVYIYIFDHLKKKKCYNFAFNWLSLFLLRFFLVLSFPNSKL